MTNNLSEKIFFRVTLDILEKINRIVEKTGLNKAEIARYYFLKGLGDEKSLPVPPMLQPNIAKHTKRGKTKIFQ